jgi:hypothetical protein
VSSNAAAALRAQRSSAGAAAKAAALHWRIFLRQGGFHFAAKCSLGSGRLGISYIEIAFSKVKRNLIERALFPLFGFRQPENLTLGIQQSTLSAHKFLIANFDEPVHELHSCRVKPINRRIIAESGLTVSEFLPPRSDRFTV